MPAVDRQFLSAFRPMLSGERRVSAVTLLSGALRIYGLELLEWDPLTLQMELADLLGEDVDSDVFDKLMAAVVAITTDRPYHDLAFFDEMINAFNDVGVSDDEDIPSPEELCNTVAQLYLLDPEPAVRMYGKTHWHHDIIRYCRTVLDDDGLSMSPAVLHFVPDRAPKAPDIKAEADPDTLSEIFREREARAKEINVWVDRQVAKIGSELAELGISLG